MEFLILLFPPLQNPCVPVVGAAALVIGFVCLRLRGPFFALATIAVGVILRIVAEKADGWNMVFGRSLEELADRHAVLDRHCADIGRDPAGVKRSVFLFCCLVDSEAERDTLAAEQLGRLGPVAERFMGAGKAANTIGAAEQVAAGLQAHLDLGFGGLHLLFPYGHEVEQIERFAAEVFDHLEV